MSLEHTDEVMMMSPRVIARPKIHFIGALKFSSGGAVLEPRSSVEQMVMTTHNGADNAQKTKRSEPLRSSNPGLINPFSDLTEVMSMRPRRQCSLGRRVDWLDDADAMTIMSELCPPADSATLARCTGWC